MNTLEVEPLLPNVLNMKGTEAKEENVDNIRGENQAAAPQAGSLRVFATALATP